MASRQPEANFSRTVAAETAYSIRDLENLTGVKTHTIRVWEQRYGLLTPTRTVGNQRCYCEKNLLRLQHIALLNRQGMRISQIAQLQPCQIAEMAGQFSKDKLNAPPPVVALFLATVALDEMAFDRVFSEHQAAFGFEKTMQVLVNPLLEKLNSMTAVGTCKAAHGKFVNQILRRKFAAAIDQICCAAPGQSETFLLFLPEAETPDLTLLFLHHFLRSRHRRVVNLGSGVCPAAIREAGQMLRPQFVVAQFSEGMAASAAREHLAQWAEVLPDSRLLVFCPQLVDAAAGLPGNARAFENLDSFTQFLEKICLGSRKLAAG